LSLAPPPPESGSLPSPPAASLAAPPPGSGYAIDAGGSGQSFVAVLAREALGAVLTVRSRRPGDRFHPSGLTGAKNLQAYFLDAKVPREQRDGIPLAVCSRGIAWIVGHRIADWALPRDGAPAVWASFSAD